jgi:hypothetical protein
MERKFSNSKICRARKGVSRIKLKAANWQKLNLHEKDKLGAFLNYQVIEIA